MSSRRRVMASLVATIAAGIWAIAAPGQAQLPRPPLVLEPVGVRGEAIFPAFEGWGPDKTGENLLLLLGYYNRNKSQELVIPIGPDNRIEPDGPDYGQPTYFYTGRQHGVFAIKVPKDFGNKRLTWTLTANGQTSTVSFWLNPPYWINYFYHPANGNEPPLVRFARNGPTMSGPPVGIAQTLSGTVGQPVPLSLWASDPPTLKEGAEAELRARTAPTKPNPASVAIVGDQVIGGGATGTGASTAGSSPSPDVTVNWRKHRGPGEVTFAQAQILLVTKGDQKVILEASTTATFSAPGEYVLRAQVNDTSGDGGGGEQCCWTTAHVRVNVK
ncbi:MAG: hypothetical protein EHM89_01600 [Acidobacteria bacterium]|nr:MAG: hypothetical protein EHM89_01600 [Acidobacteriota bacterium]